MFWKRLAFMKMRNRLKSETSKEHKDSFFKSFRPLLIFAQVCGLLPVRGIFGSHHGQIKFTWKNPMILYVLVAFLMICFYDYSFAEDKLVHGIRLDNFAPVAFYTVCLMNIYFFMNVAKKLPWIYMEFADLEKQMMDYPKCLGLHMKVFLTVFAFLSILEHGMMTIMSIRYAFDWSSKEPIGTFEAFYRIQFDTISKIIPYSWPVTIFIFWMNVTATLNWNYLDFFLIAICMEISGKLTALNERIFSLGFKDDTTTFWRKIRTDYNRISILTKKLDRILSKMIITSYLSNLYHLSLQLLRSLRINGSVYQKCYFYFSLMYLILRLLMVSLSAAKINEESKKPIDVVYCLKQPSQDATRFLHQVVTDDVAFTGCRFFIINRRFVMTIFGTLLTYEIILLQFNSLQYES